jgi:tetratricopeptide (TPR) repeat protein
MSYRKYALTSLLMGMLVLLFVISADGKKTGQVQSQTVKEPEVISLLGKKLYAEPATGDQLKKLQDELRNAMRQVELNPDDPEALILYGRRLAYLWRYHDAIDIYSKGIEKYPDHAMLYRHRGHRYISVREFKKAVDDLTLASQLDDRSFDIWYHLGLAHYLLGEFEKASSAYESCLKVSEDDDSKIAVSNWLYITLRRLGRIEEAAKILGWITEGMEIEENQSYYDLLLLYKGIKTEDEISVLVEASDLDLATIGYGLGCWFLYNGKSDKARAIFYKIVNTNYWPAFGFIAAESELYRGTTGIP